MPELDGAVLEAPEVVAPDDGGEIEAEPLEPGTEIEPEQPAESEEIEPEGEETEVEPGEEGKTDDRTLPDAIKKAIKAIRTSDPATAKVVKQLYYSDQEYRAAFPKPSDAVAAKTLIEQVGGPEGLQQIESERQEWTALDQKFEEGSGDFVKSIAEANPDAFVKIAPHAINEWATRAPEQYGYYANTVALNTLKQSGIDLRALAAAHGRYKDNPEAQGIIAEIHNALYDLKQKATDFEQKRTDPREEQLKQKETAFEQKRRADFETGVATQAETFLKEKMQPEIDRILAGRKVDPEAAEMMQSMVEREVQKRLAEIPNFENQLETFYRTGDAQKSTDYIKAQYNRILPEAVKKVITPLYRNIQAPVLKKAVAQNGARSAAPGEVVLKEMPDWKDVDQSKTTVADMIQGKAILKNGKTATGWA